MKPPLRIAKAAVTGSAKRAVLENESMYSVWGRHCEAHGLEGGVNSPLPPHILRLNLFKRLDPLDAKYVAREMAIDEGHVQKLVAADLGGNSQLVVVNSLRFCVKCLDLGYHSAVYQHIALSSCPLHAVPLIDGCPHCHEAITPTFISVIQSPFECPHCGGALARTVPRPQDHSDATLADQMAGGRRGALLPQPENNHWDLLLNRARILVGPPGQQLASRHYQRLCIWADRSNTHWLSFAEEMLHVVPAHSRGLVEDANSFDLGLAAERVLIWLRQVCYAHEYSAVRLAYRLGRYPRGLRINAHGSLLGAALYRLAVAYDLVQEMQTLFEADVLALDQPKKAVMGRKMVRYGASCPEVPQLDFRLFQLEMLGIFAKFLVAHRHLEPMVNVSWLELPHPMEFAPNWTSKKSLNGVCYRIRARATEIAVQRLVIRKWNDELSYVNHDVTTPDGFWLHNQLDTVWSDRPRPADLFFAPRKRPIDVPTRPVRPLAQMFTPSSKPS